MPTTYAVRVRAMGKPGPSGRHNRGPECNLVALTTDSAMRATWLRRTINDALKAAIESGDAKTSLPICGIDPGAYSPDWHDWDVFTEELTTKTTAARID